MTVERIERRLTKRERQDRILGELRASPAVRVSEVAERLGVHAETVRRDLDELHRRGRVSRTYGGAAAAPLAFEPSLAERHATLVAERTRIGELAASLVEPGDVVMVDVGSTTSHFARRLSARGLEATVITNSYGVLAALANAPSIRLILCPGEYSARQGGVAGPDTVRYLERFRASKAVIGAGGLTAEGPSEYEPDFAWVKREMLERAQARLLILDRSKFGRAVLDRICPLSALTHLIVDAPPEGELMRAVEEAGVRLLVAS
jgi:DeoR/GlpR family transcriptional regulator of sugar metabolism